MTCHTFTCGDLKNCRKCYAAATVPELAKSLNRPLVKPLGPSLSVPLPPREFIALKRPPCVHEEGILERCRSCGETGELNHVRGCEIHDRCTRGRNNGTVASCLSCPDHKPAGVGGTA